MEVNLEKAAKLAFRRSVIRIAALMMGAIVVALLIFAADSMRRRDPPLSLLKGRQHTMQDGLPVYQLPMRYDEFVKVADQELKYPDWTVGSSDYASEQGMEGWTFYTNGTWEIEFREDEFRAGEPNRLTVRVHQYPPPWLAWIKEKLGWQ
jgi:hypothetical protein